MQTYNGSCAIDAGCNPSQNLYCNVTEQFPNTCQCLPYNYWSSLSSTCVAQKISTNPCSSTSECLSESGLYCSGTCQCRTNYFWLSALKVCIRRATYGEQCTVIPQDSTLNLICGGSGYSVCPANTFWNGSYCGTAYFLYFFIS